jgi:hypothetical protein
MPDKERKRCKYPMSQFHNFEDEVPAGARVSTADDCKACDDEDCEMSHCLIEDGKYKKCFNHCPKCNATDPDIEWGDKEWDGSGAWQEATCKKCGCEFQEVYEYTTTMIK